MKSEQFGVLKPIGTCKEPSNFRFGHVVSVFDGDTVHGSIDVGVPGTPLSLGGLGNGDDRLRLHGINAPELNTANGPNSQKHLVHLLTESKCFTRCIFEVLGRDNFGRTTVVIYGAKDGRNINRKQLADGFAEPLRDM